MSTPMDGNKVVVLSDVNKVVVLSVTYYSDPIFVGVDATIHSCVIIIKNETLVIFRFHQTCHEINKKYSNISKLIL
jgi:hypothetical protein